jgi:hypothetical protein
MYNFNYEYMTFLYVVHVYMFCNVVLYCIVLPARVVFAIKIIYYYYYYLYEIKHLLYSINWGVGVNSKLIVGI